MGCVARAIAFAVGMGLTGALLFFLSFRWPQAWQPLLFAGGLCALVAAVPWRPRTRFLAPYGLTLLAGAVGLWIGSSDAPVTHASIPLHRLTDALGMAAALGLLLTLIGWARLDARQRGQAAWLMLLLVCAFCVAFASGSPGSGQRTLGWLGTLLGLEGDAALMVNRIVRKTIHFVFYGLVALFALRSAQAVRAPWPAASAFALVVLAWMAAFDELRQSTVPNRTGTATDLLVDLVGGCVFLLVARPWLRVRSKEE